MKLIISLLTLIVTVLPGLAQEIPFTIKVSARRYDTGRMAYLQYKGQHGPVIDSARIENGSLTFSGAIDEPRPASILFKTSGKKVSGQDKFKFFIEPGNLIVEARGLMSTAGVQGSQNTKDMDKLDPLLLADPPRGSDPVVERIIVAVPAGQGPPRNIAPPRRPISAMQGPKKPAEDPNAPPYDIFAVIGGISESSKEKVLDYIRTNPSSYVSAYALFALWRAKKLDYAAYNSLVNSLDAKVRNSNEGKEMFGG